MKTNVIAENKLSANEKSVITTQNSEVISSNINTSVKQNVLANVLKQMQNTSVLKTSKGLKKEQLYKQSVFADCLTDREKKTTRRQIRNLLESFIASMLRCKSFAQKEAIAKDFVIFYNEIYAVNDFTIESLTSNNSDEIKKENIGRFLDEIKKYKK